eukprot:4022048-Heterocapsa_arctica.AAC.1
MATRDRHRPGRIAVGGKPRRGSRHGLRHLAGSRCWTMGTPTMDRRPGRRTRPHERATATTRRARC